MRAGACLCGATAYEFDGEPKVILACHCLPCRKISGTSASINLMVPRSALRVTAAEPKTFKRQGDSGKDVTYSFCAVCPTTLFVALDAMPDMYMLKIGALEDAELYNEANISMEIFTRNRPPWCEGWFAGARQLEGSAR